MMTLTARGITRALTVLAVVAATAGCGTGADTPLEQLQEARRVSSDLILQFSKLVDAGNRAVMADTDDASVAFAGEVERGTRAVQSDIDALSRTLVAPDYSSEGRLLKEFSSQFAQYRALDQAILGLAVENTNLKAQRLSFGSGHQAADAFRDALVAVRRAAPANDAYRIEALVATAVAAAREIQTLQAPHIAEADDATMTRLEQEMAAAEATARQALGALPGLVPPGSRPSVEAATGAFERFMSVNAEIVALSRRNSNVRSLALSLGQKRTLTATCEETLDSLQRELEKRSLGGAR